jgi:hypothetical protein
MNVEAEAGERPARPRHCNGRSERLNSHWVTGKASRLPEARRRHAFAPPIAVPRGGEGGNAKSPESD